MSDVNAGVLVREGTDASGRSTATLERDSPNTRLIVIAVIAILTIISVVVYGLVELFTWTLRAEVRRKQLEPVSTLLRDVRAEEQAKLNRYQWIDPKAGIVRIPLERAKQLVILDYAKPEAKVEAKPEVDRESKTDFRGGGPKAESGLSSSSQDPQPAGDRSR